VTYRRVDNDFYCEPPEAVHALLNAHTFLGDSWDPACGRGNIPSVFQSRGRDCAASDIVDRGWPGVTVRNFFETDATFSNIVSNPPYGQAEAFIHHALKLAQRDVAMLLRLPFLESQRRAELFRSTPLSRVLIFPWRISMPPGDMAIKAVGGKIAYAWFVWERGFTGPPVIGWLEKPKAAA
jgi:hypothetical protein